MNDCLIVAAPGPPCSGSEDQALSPSQRIWVEGMLGKKRTSFPQIPAGPAPAASPRSRHSILEEGFLL